MTINATDFSHEETADSRVLSCKLDAAELPDELWMKVRGSALDGHQRALVADWALVSLLYPAMSYGQDLHIDAPVSASLLERCNAEIQVLLRTLHPELSIVRVTARKTVEPVPAEPSLVATGFSAGIDSFTSLNIAEGEDVPPSRRLNCLTIFNVGAFGVQAGVESAAERFESYSDRVQSFAKANGYDWFTVDSNISKAYTTPSCLFVRTHTLRNVAAALAMADRLSCYHYSSTYTYDVAFKSTGIASVDPILLPLLSQNGREFISSGAHLTRGEKTKIVSTDDRAMQLLDVCLERHEVSSHGKNCGNCWKCRRTFLTLEALGRGDDFRPVFDVDAARDNRTHHLNEQIYRALNGWPNDIECIEMLSEVPEFADQIKKLRPKQRLRYWASKTKRMLLGRDA